MRQQGNVLEYCIRGDDSKEQQNIRVSFLPS